MRRCDFIKVIAGSATVWPLAAHAQQPTMPVIGFLNSASPEVFADRLRAFHLGLKDTGFVEGENVTVVLPLGREPIRSTTRARGGFGSATSGGDCGEYSGCPASKRGDHKHPYCVRHLGRSSPNRSYS